MTAATRIRLPALLILVTSALLSCSSRPSVDDRAAEHPWLVTVYYTAVESYHRDQLIMVTGCRARPCAHGTDTLGWYPRDFVAAVHDEGTGRITSGQPANQYLNWSHDVGYWLDDAPRDAHGRPLEPFRSAAADGIPDGTRLQLVNCGRLESGEPVSDEVCQALRAADWEVRDQFTPGHGGDHHIDLYIGEESEANYTATAAMYVTLTDARLVPRT